MGDVIIIIIRNVHQKHDNKIVLIMDGKDIKICIAANNLVIIIGRIEMKEIMTGVNVKRMEINIIITLAAVKRCYGLICTSVTDF